MWRLNNKCIPCWAKSENVVPEFDGERLRATCVVPEGLRSRGRRGWGAVTVGLEGKTGFERELGMEVPPGSTYVAPEGGWGVDAAASL